MSTAPVTERLHTSLTEWQTGLPHDPPVRANRTACEKLSQLKEVNNTPVERTTLELHWQLCETAVYASLAPAQPPPPAGLASSLLVELSQVFIFRCHLKTPSQSGPQVLFKNAIKNSVKIRPVFWTFLPICNTRCCIRSPAWPTYSTPNGTRVLTPGCNISGFPWRSERQSQPCTFRSCGAESRPSAWCLRNPSQASGPQSFQRIGDN